MQPTQPGTPVQTQVFTEETYRQAEVAYSAYFAHARGVSLVSGAALPIFADAAPAIRDAWAAAALAVLTGRDPQYGKLPATHYADGAHPIQHIDRIRVTGGPASSQLRITEKTTGAFLSCVAAISMETGSGPGQMMRATLEVFPVEWDVEAQVEKRIMRLCSNCQSKTDLPAVPKPEKKQLKAKGPVEGAPSEEEG